jgi:hypothetical protein
MTHEAPKGAFLVKIKGGKQKGNKMGELKKLVDDRKNDGVAVEWFMEGEDALIVVTDSRNEDYFELPADKTTAKDVFEHPFAVKAFRDGEEVRWQPSPEPEPNRFDLALDELNSLSPLDRQEVLGRLAANQLFGSPTGIVELVTRQKRASENWDYEEAA